MKKNAKSRRWLWVGATAVIVAGLLAWGLGPQPVSADVAVVKRAPMIVTVDEEGKTRARDRYVVSAPVAGFVRRVRWKAGDAIRSGDIVAELEPLRSQALDPRTREQSEARVRVADAAFKAAEQRARTAEDQVRTAQVEAAFAKQELERHAKLMKSGDTSQSRYDQAAFEAQRMEAALSTARQAAAAASAEVETAGAETVAARAALIDAASQPRGSPDAKTVSVRAPVGGRVLKVTRESEGVVNPGDPLLEIANARALEVEIEVLSADAVRIAPGSRVLLSGWGGDQPIEARVRVIEPTGFTKISALGVEEQRVHVIADIVSPEQEWRRLGDGYRVEAGVVLWEDQSALQVPASAVFRSGDGWAVFLVEGEIARRRVVETGRRTGLAVQILSGLQEGDRVIVHPDEALEDGKRVRILQPVKAARTG
jgi:HlyD family secretion protein